MNLLIGLKYNGCGIQKKLYKETLNDDMEFCEIEIINKSKCEVELQGTLRQFRFRQNKKKDMGELLPFILPVMHIFYNYLTGISTAAEDNLYQAPKIMMMMMKILTK